MTDINISVSNNASHNINVTLDTDVNYTIAVPSSELEVVAVSEADVLNFTVTEDALIVKFDALTGDITDILDTKSDIEHQHILLDISDLPSGVTAEKLANIVDTTGPIQSQLNMKLEWVLPPVTRNSVGTPGQIAFEDDYFFICVAQDLWARTILTKGF